ncbi:hypothetical protein I2I05_19575 [Hymenobacter sp. BT683]|uniref:Uncharacterized protein n=1 Tax=Hymenobacter jeongseonensis TaxID=2791027 RepID=A0ABS0IMM7_9BACT|nr:hypothetical protein [Hymenobacter jeongseonensis]MBF9239602.1 hypothetical protein [Hymenobacter jeongseonensis]
MTNEQEKFEILGDNGDHISITFVEVWGFPNTTSFVGGYDVLAAVIIKAGGFQVISNFYTSTGEIYELLKQLVRSNEQLSGVVRYASFEGNLEFTAEYDTLGHVQIKGCFLANDDTENRLIFSIKSDQSFMNLSINQLKLLADKYGDNMGVGNK